MIQLEGFSRIFPVAFPVDEHGSFGPRTWLIPRFSTQWSHWFLILAKVFWISWWCSCEQSCSLLRDFCKAWRCGRCLWKKRLLIVEDSAPICRSRSHWKPNCQASLKGILGAYVFRCKRLVGKKNKQGSHYTTLGHINDGSSGRHISWTMTSNWWLLQAIASYNQFIPMSVWHMLFLPTIVIVPLYIHICTHGHTHIHI